MEAGDVFVRVAQAKLMKNVVPHLLRGAGSESGNRTRRKVFTQLAQLPIFRTKLVSPFGDAVGLVDCKQRDGNLLQPIERVFARQSFRRKIQQAKFSAASSNL